MAENKENPDKNIESQNIPTNSLINIISEQNITKDEVQSPSNTEVVDNPQTINFTGITSDMITVFPEKSQLKVTEKEIKESEEKEKETKNYFCKIIHT